MMQSGEPTKATAIQPVQRRSLSDEIARQLTALIAEGQLQPGQRLPSERDLCKQFGVGRTSLREGLRALTAMGLLEARVGEGTFVRQGGGQLLENALRQGLMLDGHKLEDLTETRLVLETQTASLAAQRATAADLEAIGQALSCQEAAMQQPDAYLAADLEFHLAIAKATQNGILYQLLSTIRSYLQEWIRGALGPDDATENTRAERSLHEHRLILSALLHGDVPAAAKAMRDHIQSSGRDLRVQLEDG